MSIYHFDVSNAPRYDFEPEFEVANVTLKPATIQLLHSLHPATR